MAFSTTQLRELKRDLKESDIRTRQTQGRELSYIEGWHSIAEANRIFGYDAWSRETIESKCVLSRENRGAFHVVYVAKVRISVRAKEQVIVREGFGTGEAQVGTLGEAHDKAIKTAETDATKRALATFGKPFGLALYLGHRAKPPAAERPDIARRRTLQRLGSNGRYYVPRHTVPPLDPALAAPANENATPPAKASEGDPDSGDGETAPSSSAPSPLAEPEVQTGGPVEGIAKAEPAELAPVSTAVPSARPGALLLPRAARRREPAHLKFVATQPCLLCGRTPSDAHHLRFAQPRALGRKVSDEFAVPLCRTHHRQLHQTGNEVDWWMDMDIDPLPIARDLWEEFQTRGKGAEAPSPIASKS